MSSPTLALIDAFTPSNAVAARPILKDVLLRAMSPAGPDRTTDVDKLDDDQLAELVRSNVKYSLYSDSLVVVADMSARQVESLEKAVEADKFYVGWLTVRLMPSRALASYLCPHMSHAYACAR